MGRRARERVLDEHTYRHRARQLLDLLSATVSPHEEDRHRPRVQRARRDRRRGRRAAGVRSRARRARHRRRFARCDRRACAAAHGATRAHGFRSTSASAVPCRRGSATRRSTTTSSRSASTATASTTRRSSARCSTVVLGGEADICVGSRFAGADGYRSSATRRIGIRILAGTVSLITAPARHRHDERLPGR